MKLDYAGLVANYCSLGLVAICGILINVIIIKEFTPADLGVYNLGYALFVIVSQLSCCGVHLSCLKSLSVAKTAQHSVIMLSALILVVVLSVTVSTLFFMCGPYIISLFSGSSLDRSIPVIAIALVFYSINKVLMFSINGLGRMKLYASFQTARALLLLSYIGLAATVRFDYPLVGAFLFSELVLAGVLLALLYPNLRVNFRLKALKLWALKHFKFGRSALLGGLSTELNTRVDVLFLAFFLSDAIVGVYSFVSMLVEGFYQLLVVVKANINPLLAKFIHKRQYRELERFTHKIFIASFLGLLVCAALMYAVYPFFVGLLGLGIEVASANYILATLLMFMVMASGWMPFDQILTQAGRPILSSRLYLIVTLINIMMNLALVPFLGMLGAAIATGISWLAFSLLLNSMVNKYLNVSLFPLVRNWKG